MEKLSSLQLQLKEAEGKKIALQDQVCAVPAGMPKAVSDDMLLATAHS